MQRKYIASLAGSLLLTSALSGCGAVTTAQTGAERQLPTAIPAPTSPPAVKPAIPAAPALPQLADAGNALLNDEFDTDLKRWSVKDISGFPSSEAADWQARDGRVDQITGPDGLPSTDPTSLLIGDSNLADYTVQAMGQSRGNEIMGLVGRASEQGYYALVVRHAKSDGPKVMLQKYDAASEKFSMLASSEQGGWELDAWTALGLTITGDTLTAYVNGQPVLEAKDSTFATGRAGLYGYGLGELSFDHFLLNAAK